MVASLKQAMPQKYNCVGRNYLGEGQRAMLHYFGGILTQSDSGERCDLHLVQGDRSERYRLYRKVEKREAIKEKRKG